MCRYTSLSLERMVTGPSGPSLSESDAYLPLSGLQHVVFCERQAALIHIERVWQENLATVQGQIVHQRVDQPGRDHRRGLRVARAVPLVSHRLRVTGIADTVEFRKEPGGGETPCPVEFKRGPARPRLADQVQLCAQALCLEEQHARPVLQGALFYDASHRRVPIEFTTELRAATLQAAQRFHTLVAQKRVPRASPAPHCRACSLEPLCLPLLSAHPERTTAYIARLFADLGEDAIPKTTDSEDPEVRRAR